MTRAAGDGASSPEELRAAFDGAAPLTVGIEDEVMLLDPETLGLLPCAPDALELMDGDPRYKLELPAAHLEIVTPPASRVGDAAHQLHRARSDLAERIAGRAVLASAGVHPFSPGAGDLNQLERYRHTIVEYAPVAPRQLVCALQVHVAVGSAEVALPVYNAARCFLPLLAGLAANAPFYEGQDTGLASVRPLLCTLLPRQGVPPRIETWTQYAEDLSWGQESGAFVPGAWWWELRPHRRHGTLEFRVPDGQTAVSEAAAIAAVAQALVAWLVERHEAGEALPTAPSWRIAENRWLACRHGVEGDQIDLDSGGRRPARALLHELLDQLEPAATRLQAQTELASARQLVERNGARMQREVAAHTGMPGLGRWLAERFLEPVAG